MAKKMKNVLLMGLSFVLVAALAIGGTIAYLTDTDSDVNVMTLGQAQIEQLEKERVDMTHQDQQTPAELKDWEISPLYPAVWNEEGKNANDPAAWQPGIAADEAYVNYGTLVDADITGPHWTGVWDSSLKNVKDKMVFVKNTGSVDVYYRTIILYEYDETETKNSYDQTMIHFNVNGNSRFNWAYPEYTVNVGGEVYGVMVATYNVPLKPGTTSRPSLIQVGLDGDATNEIVEQFGNTYDILVLSQAIQTAGFADAQTALDTGFGAVNTTNVAKWFGDEKIPVVAENAEDLADALAAGEDVILAKDLTVEQMEIPAGTSATLDLNGYTLSGEIEARGAVILNKGTLTVKNGTLESTVTNGGYVIHNMGTLTVEKATLVGAPYDSTITSPESYPRYVVNNQGAATISDTTVICNHGGVASNDVDAVTTLNTVNITMNAPTSGGHGVYAVAGSKTVIDGGSISIDKDAPDSRKSVFVEKGATVTVKTNVELSRPVYNAK